jgi:hypothetical protein
MPEEHQTHSRISRALKAIREEQRLEKEEPGIIGRILYAFHKTEYLVSELIGYWAYPVMPGRQQLLRDELLLKVPIRDKLEFLKENKLLDPTLVGSIHAIFLKRNMLAHPRSPKKTMSAHFSEADQKKILSTLAEANDVLWEQCDIELSKVEEYARNNTL